MESPAEETPDAPVIEPGLNGGNAQAEEPVSEEPVAAEEPDAVEVPEAEQAETASGPSDDAVAEESVAAEEPVEAPAAEEPAAVEEPVEAPAAEEPAAVEEPAVDEPAAAMEEPVATAASPAETSESAPADASAAGETQGDEEPAGGEAPSTEMPEQVVLSGEDERALAEVLRTAIAEEAERLAASTRYAESAQGFRDLLERWKSAPSAGQMRDRELWRRFAAARAA